MAKISTYPSDNNPSLSDRLIGSDAESNNATKNYSIFNVLDVIGDYYADAGTGPAGYVLTSNGSGLAPTWQAAGGSGGYVPYTGATGDVSLGNYGIGADYVSILGSGLYIDFGVEIQLNEDPGQYGEIMMSQGTGDNPQWVTFASVFNSYKGSFYSSTTQTLTGGANVGIPVRLPITDAPLTNGVSIDIDGSGNPTFITANNNVDANFNFMFSAQLANSAGPSQVVDFWLRINGTDVPNSNGKVQLQSNNTFVMAAWNYFIRLNEGDYVQLMWAATSTNVTMVADPINAVHPATPSIIVTLNQV